jgi:SAM-dependent methyltransferase
VIKVLHDWNEVGEATLALQRRGLPTHGTPQKNWDLCALDRVVQERAKATVLDLGCGSGEGLKMLCAAGTCAAVHGIDLHIAWRLRLSQWKRRLAGPSTQWFQLHRGDIAHLPFASESIDVAFAISVIEHGVPLDAFFGETSRVLRPGGALFVTTDYWPDPVQTESAQAFGLPWKVFTRSDIAAIVSHAARYGLMLEAPMDVPDCGRATVHWQRCDYTFIQLLFGKTSAGVQG